MPKRAASALIVSTILLAAVCTAQTYARPGMALVRGRVVTVDGRPAANVRVDLRNMASDASLRSSFTDPSGQFEIGDVAPGRYMLVATSGFDEASEGIQVLQMAAFEVILRLPRSFAGASTGNAYSVSVQQLKVPSKARDALKHAHDALAKQRTDEAWKQVNKALSLYPKYAEALVLRGAIRLGQADFERARADMEEAVQADPQFGMGYIALAATYNAQSRFDDALHALDRGVALSPAAWQGYCEMGKAYLGKGDYQTSLKHLSKAQQLGAKDFAPVHWLKAQALLRLKSYDEAKVELEAYLSQNPEGQNLEHARDALDKVQAFVARNKE